jgi:hypothetical protein
MDCYLKIFPIFTYQDKLHLITLYPGFVLTISSRMTIFAGCLKFDLDKMGSVEIAHLNVPLSIR